MILYREFILVCLIKETCGKKTREGYSPTEEPVVRGQALRYAKPNLPALIKNPNQLPE